MKGIFTAIPLIFIFLSTFLNAQITTSSQWAWMKGDNTVNAPGVYGTQGVGAESNKPGARGGGCSSWKDAAGNFWLFGGYNYTGPSFNDLWKYTPSTNQWIWMNGPSGGGQPGVYGTLGVPAAGNRPGSRYVSSTWTDISGNLWLFGGAGFNDLWKYNPSTNQWAWMNGANTSDQPGVYGTMGVSAAGNRPGARNGSSSWTDATGNLWLFGGTIDSGGVSNYFNDLWKYNPTTNQWTWMNGANVTGQAGVYGTTGMPAAANTPGARSSCYTWTDASGNFWLFGGGPTNSNAYNDLWKYNPTTNQWACMSGTSALDQVGVYGTQGVAANTNRPGGRGGGAACTDATGAFYLFCGYGKAAAGTGYLNDLWKFDPATGQWTWLKGSNSPYQQGVYGTQGTPNAGNFPGARAPGSSWMDGSGNFWLFGGANGAGLGYLNDLWKLTTAPIPNLTINDVSHNEGNSGTTTYTFTVSLSAPAPAGGVTFNIATANGTATASSDYIAKSLTAQTIPAGSSTYTFDVLVNGDLTVESDQPFFVNITNVTGATVTRGQGIGTIINDDAATPPQIISFSPTSGPIGTTVTITGNNFSPAPANNIVYFGAVKATVSAATTTLLTVAVPFGTTYQPITVTTNGLTAYAAQPFIVTFSGSTMGFTPNSFATKVDYATGSLPESVAIGDIDGDGKPDLVVANRSSNTVSALRNISSSGTVSFAAKVDYAAGTNPYGVVIGDVDGDGKPDLVIANTSTNTVSVLRNTSSSGTVSFAAKVDYATGTNPFSVAIGDVDGDGKPDLAVTNNGSHTVSVLRNTSNSGTVSFVAKVDYATGSNPHSVAMGDVDGDGKPDLAVVNYTLNTISVLRNTGSAGAVSFAAKVDYATGSNPYRVAIGDLDKDDKPDLAVTNTGSNTVSVLRNGSSNGAVSFAAKVDYATGIDPRSVAIGDVDGDGKPDLAVANTGSNTVSVLKNASSGGAFSFAAKVDYATGSSPYRVVIGDVNGDGRPDLAVANRFSNNVSILRNQVAELPQITLFTPTNAGIGATVTITGANFTGATAVNFGGVPATSFTVISPTQITAVVGGIASGLVSVTTPNGTATLGGFYNGHTITSLSPSSGPVGTMVTITGTGFSPVAANNIIYFGAVKAVVSAATATSLTVAVPVGTTYLPITVTTNGLTVYSAQPFIVTFAGGGTGFTTNSFAPKVDYAAGSNPRSVAIADLDGDGKPDLAVVNLYSHTISLLRNTGTNGAVSFAAKVDYSTGNAPYSVAIGDVDGDGKPDLAVTNYSSNTVSIFKNTSSNGVVSFTAKVDYTTGSNPYSVVIGDLDADGKPDLAVTNTNSNTVSVLRNTSTSGMISFAVKVDYPAGTAPYSIAIGDLDGDGKSDLVVGNDNSSTVGVLRNTGSSGAISFATKVDYATGSRPLSVAIGDLDGDGKPDLAATNYNSATISVLRNTSNSGAISFAAKLDYATGNNPYSVAIGDVDGDGKPNLTVANYASNTISLFKNTGSNGTVSLANKVDCATGSNPYSVAIGDVDGDGKPDLAVANSTSTVSVLRNQLSTNILTIGSFITTNLCAGGPLDITFTTSENLNPNNVFTAQLSDSSGSFANPVNIGTLSGYSSDTIRGIIPSATLAGANYHMRVISSSPAISSLPNTSPIIISRTPSLNFTITGNTAVCPRTQAYSASIVEPGVTWKWQVSGGGTLTASGGTATINWTTTGNYIITLSDSNSCGNGPVRTLNISVSATPASTPVLTNTGRILKASALPVGATGYHWYKNGTLITGVTDLTYNAQVAGIYTVKFFNTCGEGLVSNSIEFTNDAGAQTISFPAIPAKTFGDAAFRLTATASSGLPVNYRVVSGPVSIIGDTVFMNGTGTAVIEATQPGNNTYNPATPAQQSFTVIPDLSAPDLAVQQVEAVQTIIAPGDTVAITWKVANVGTASSAVNWTERIYIQSADGQNRTLLKQVNFANNTALAINQVIVRSTVITIPYQFNIGDLGVFVVELIPGNTIHEASGTAANNTGIQQTPWAIRKLLSVQLSASQITEGGEGIIAVINRTGSLLNALTANINLNHPDGFSFPTSVVIPAGQAGNSFSIFAPDNNAINGTIRDTLHVSAAGFQTATAALSLLDNDKASLSITALPVQAMEGSSVTFKVTTNLAPLAPLPVFLTSNNQVRFPVPPSVTIPAGSLFADVTVSLQQDSIPEIDLGVSIIAGASNHNPANATVRVKDDDLPNLELIIQTNMISEGAGPYATQVTLRRTATSNSVAFTANLSASLPNTLILPGSISLAAGQNEKSFTIGVIENSLVDSQRQVLVTASIFVSSCGCSAPPASSGSVSASITINDNDGASLKLTAARLTLPEGSANAGLLRVTRNTNTTTALLVNLTSSDTTEAVIPATVLIPVGQLYVDVPITTINDGISDGSQTVYFQTTASGYSSGSVWVIVTDLNKPDLLISSVTLSNASIQSTDVFNYQVAVKNTGFATAPPGVLVRGYLSSDTIIDASDTLISEDIISGSIGTGQTVTVINAARPSRLPGYYKLLFWVNPDATLAELLATNNTSQPANLALLPDYTATANVGPAYYIQGTPVPVTGTAVRINGTPAANERVEVYIITNGLRRKVLATTNAAGNYTAQFIPLAKESGHYTMGASFPGMGETAEQDAFDILGVRINDGNMPQFRVILNDTLRGSLTVQNLSNTSLTNFSLAPVTLINGTRFRFDTIRVLTGNTIANISYSITSSAFSSGNNFEVATLQAKADEGVIQTTDVYYFSQAPNAYVVADITNIHITASQSIGERIVEFRLVNKGRGSTGNVTVQLPQVAWMSSVTPQTLPSIAPGDTAIVILKFLTLPEVPFNYPITGNIVIRTQNGNSLSIPFSFEKVSETTGMVKITVTNQFTYYTDGAPKVKGALVKIKNYFSGVVYAQGYTDSTGVFTAGGIPEGRHRITVDKDKHLPYNSTVTIDPGDTVSSTVFLNYQAITFSWNVVPTAVQDQYDITLTAQFETHIPIPVVTIQMPDTMPQLYGSDVFAFNATLTNHGLITAKDVTLALPQNDPEYEFVMNYEPSDLLAQQSIQVPVLMRRRTSPPARGTTGPPSIADVSQFLGMQTSQYRAAAASSGSSSDCRPFAGVIWWYPCAFEILRVTNAIPFHYSGRICSRGPLPIVVNIPPNYPTFPCAICPTPGPPPASGSPDTFKIEKKSCIECIVKIIGLMKCSRGPVVCGGAIVQAIYTCLSAASSGISNSLSVANAAPGQNAANPLGAVFQEIADNLKAAIDAYQFRDNQDTEYFGDLMLSDAWSHLAPMLAPYVVNSDTIPPADQAGILTNMAGYEIPPSAIQTFFTRWNISVHAQSEGILEPNAQYPGIINWVLVRAWSDSIAAVNNLAISKGFASFDDMFNKTYQSLNEILDQQSQAVCASVTVQFSQQLTMTREAFEGTLEIFNGHPTDAMDSLSVNIQITDEAGVPSNGLFEIQTKSLTNLADVMGTGAINAQQKGSVKFLFIPESGAAPQVPKEYNFGGWVRYWDPYARAIVTLPLASVPLTVNPSPNLMLHYFMERNILGDDALTSPDIEPSVPAELAVMVENQGYGPAVNMTISSSQPKVVDNEKGLAINFNLIGSNFQGQPRNLGVTNINFGTIPPLQTRIGQWYFTSSLLGKFVSYKADVVHANSFGNPELSLIKDVKLHELTRSIRDYKTDDGINDFLANDIFDIYDRPDVIYFSQGNRKAKVYPATTGSFSSPVLPPTFTNTFTVTASDTGWNYIQLDDPGNKRYDLISVTRSDGQVIPLSNAWTTFVTLPVSRQPVYENKFHFADSFPSMMPVSYTVVWKPKNLNVPRVDSITGLPQQVTSTQVQHLKVVFNKKINPATFTHEDMTLIFQGGLNIMDASVVITQIDTATFNVDLSALTTGNGFYSLVVQSVNVSDVYGINGLLGKQATWTQFLTVPTVQAFQGIPPSHMSALFDTIRVLFNLPIDETTVTPVRFTITKDGVPQSGTLTIDSVRADHKLFYLSGLGNILTQTGEYLLSVDLPNIKTINNVFGMQPQSVTLILDNTGPAILNLAKSDSGSIDQHHIPFIHIQFNEDVVGFHTASVQLTRNGEVLPLSITQLSNTDLKTWVAGNFGMLTYPEGNYIFTIQLDSIKDAGGNRGVGSQQIAWTVDRSALVVTTPVITPDLGFSGTDGITSGQSFQVAFNLSANASQVTISQFDLSGETVLIVIPSVAAGNVSLPVTLLTGGNTGIKISATGANGRVGTSQKALFIDQMPLTARWLFTANQTITRQPDTIAILFSSKLLSNAGFLNAVQFKQNGVLVPTTGLSSQRLNDTLYHIYGFRQISSISGDYELSFNLQSFKKYSSGRSDSGSVAVSWTLQKDNHAPIANAGNDITLATPGLVTLNGGGSSDPDADPITYRWIAPTDIILSDSTSATPAFTLTNANQQLVYSFLLIVSDGLLFTTDIVNVSLTPSQCPGTDKYFTISKPGDSYTYQWQIDSAGVGFINLTGDAIHSGVNTDTLYLHTPPTSYSGYKYRCTATKGNSVIYGTVLTLKFAMVWQGNSNTAWEDPINWSCGVVPDRYTDVIIKANALHPLTVSSNASCRSLTASTGATVTIAAGYNLDIRGK